MSKEDVIKNLFRVKLVIGNGFDLFCGIKTSYSDFFNYSGSLIDNIKKWKESFEPEKFYHYLDHSIQNHESFASTVVLNDAITIWDIFFYLCSPVKKDGEILWCDIEAEMANSLDASKDNKFFSWNRVLSACNDNNIVNFRKQELICSCYLKSKLGFNIDPTRFYQFLYKELNKFEKRFGEYINSQMANPKYKSNAHKTIKKLIDLNQNKYLVIDTFNYSTFNIDGVLLNHINGTHLKPIFGIDYSNIKAIDERYTFTKIYRRLEQNFTIDEENINFSAKQFDNVIIFGHSLNKQDYNYFFPLFDSLEITNPSFNGKLVFAYSIYDSEKKEQIKKDLILKVANLLREYEIYSKGKDENRLLEILYLKGCITYYSISSSGLKTMDKTI